MIDHTGRNLYLILMLNKSTYEHISLHVVPEFLRMNDYEDLSFGL
jgi:hypothetical protein